MLCSWISCRSLGFSWIICKKSNKSYTSTNDERHSITATTNPQNGGVGTIAKNVRNRLHSESICSQPLSRQGTAPPGAAHCRAACVTWCTLWCKLTSAHCQKRAKGHHDAQPVGPTSNYPTDDSVSWAVARTSMIHSSRPQPQEKERKNSKNRTGPDPSRHQNKKLTIP